MFKRVYLHIQLLIILALLLASCRRFDGGPTSETPETPAARRSATPAPTLAPTAIPSPTPTVVQGTISLWHSWDEAQLPALLRRINEFRNLYPNVHFDMLYIPREDLRRSFEAAVAEGGGPAILLGPAEWGPELYDQGMISDLTGLVSPRLLDTFNPAALGESRYRGALIGLPQSIQGIVLYRNSSIIPGEPYTWSSLVSQAKEARRGEVYGAVLDRAFLYSGAHLFGLGGRLMDEEGLPAFNSPAGLRWLELLKRYEEAGPTEYFSENDFQMFEEGRAGFIIDGTWNWPALAEAVGASNLVIDPWPFYESPETTATPAPGIVARGTATSPPSARATSTATPTPEQAGAGEIGVGDLTLAGFVQSENIYLGSRLGDGSSLDAQAATKFIEFLLTPESQAGLVEVGLIPALKEDLVLQALAEMEIDQDNPNLNFVRQALKALENGFPYPIVPEMAAYITPLDIALRETFGGVDPAEALARAEAAVLEVLQATPTPQPSVTSQGSPLP